MGKKLTQQEIIEQFKKVHREKVQTFFKRENLKDLCYPVFNGVL